MKITDIYLMWDTSNGNGRHSKMLYIHKFPQFISTHVSWYQFAN